MAPKKNKLKKMLSPPQPAPVADSADDDALMDDLLAQLDSKDEVVREESVTVLKEMQINEIAQKAEEAPKKDSKARHKARQVRSSTPWFDIHWIYDRCLPQARKAAALADSYAPTDAEADARLERQAKEEEENIKRMCEELGLTLYEVSGEFSCPRYPHPLLYVIEQSRWTLLVFSGR